MQTQDGVNAEPCFNEEDLDSYPMVRRSKEIRALIPVNSSLLFFVHVPKTGGTDLAIKLQDSERFNVFSLDAPEDDYRLQVNWFSSSRPTFIRAHIYILDAWFNFLKGLTNVDIFTVLRSPYSLHVSLATMIYERSLPKQQIHKEPEIAIYEREDYHKALASILGSTDYSNNYKDIYTKYFSYALENTLLMDRLKVISIDQVDELQQRLLPDSRILDEPRLNQSKNRLSLSAQDLLNDHLLIALSKLISRQEIALYERLQAKTGSLDWISAKSASK